MRTPTFCFFATLALTLAAGNSTFAAVKVAAAPVPTADAARARLLVLIEDAKLELATDASVRADVAERAAAAQTQLAATLALAVQAQDAAAHLNAVAKETRRQAYAISDLPGLSAEQNRKSVAAMEAADVAENEARVAQFGVATTALSAAHDRNAIDALSLQLAALDLRILACNRLLKLNGAALQDGHSMQR